MNHLFMQILVLDLYLFNKDYALASVVGYTFRSLFKNSIGLHFTKVRQPPVPIKLTAQQALLLLLLIVYILTQGSSSSRWTLHSRFFMFGCISLRLEYSDFL